MLNFTQLKKDKPTRIDITLNPGVMLYPVKEPWPNRIDFRNLFSNTFGPPQRIKNDVYCWYLEWNDKIYAVLIAKKLKQCYCVGTDGDPGLVGKLLREVKINKTKNEQFAINIASVYGYL